MLLQQECDDGIADDSHICAIFLQQLCSSAVMPRPNIMQAAIGCAKSTSISAAAANLAACFNKPILPPCRKLLKPSQHRGTRFKLDFSEWSPVQIRALHAALQHLWPLSACWVSAIGRKTSRPIRLQSAPVQTPVHQVDEFL